LCKIFGKFMSQIIFLPAKRFSIRQTMPHYVICISLLTIMSHKRENYPILETGPSYDGVDIIFTLQYTALFIGLFIMHDY
jgi:hypothetical protein